jgi:hypothetical protein
VASPLRQTYLVCHRHHEKFCDYARQTGMLLEPSLDLTLSKSKDQHCSCVLTCAIECIAKESIAIACVMENSITTAWINQNVINGFKRSLLAGLDGGVAYERLDAHDGCNLQSAWIVY